MSIYLRTEKIIPDWTDYNGHMNLAFYIHLFDQGWDALLDKFQMGGESAKSEKVKPKPKVNIIKAKAMGRITSVMKFMNK